MGKVIVIYHSQQYGNTKILAEALADGTREAGAEVNLINTNERRVTLEEFLAADAVAIGTLTISHTSRAQSRPFSTISTCGISQASLSKENRLRFSSPVVAAGK
jgi:flavorubredoxin